MPQKHSVRIVSDLRPTYYDDFRCLASDCKLNCCQKWHINFGKRDYLKIKNQRCSPELSRRLEHSMRRIRGEKMNEEFMYAEISLKDGVCPLFREDGLCALQAEKGYDVLPQVCKVFPRSSYPDFSGYLKKSLSLACEGVLQLLWDLPDGIEFRTNPLPEREQVTSTYTDTFLMSRFQDIRSQCIDFLQNRKFLLPERIMLMGMALRRLMEGVDIEEWLLWARLLPGQVKAGSILSSEPDAKSILMFLMDMWEIMGPGASKEHISVTVRRASSSQTEKMELCSHDNMTPLQQAVAELLVSEDSMSLQPYLDARRRYDECFKDHAYFMENLTVNLFSIWDFLIPSPQMECGKAM